MMTDPAQIARLAEGLTKAQTKRLANVAALRAAGKQWTSAGGDLSTHTSRATTRALLDVDLLHVPWMTTNVDLTALGKRVLAHLTATQEKKDG